MKATVRFDHQLLAVEGEHTVNGMLEITAPPAPKKDHREPLRLALVIDRSGSMAGPKLEHTKEAAAYLFRRLEKDDQVALISYDDEVTLVSSMGTHSPDELIDLVHSIPVGGSTNLSGGWLKGIEEAGRAKDGISKVLLLTDGIANVGITDALTLVGMAEKARGEKVSTTTIGFGERFDEELLTAMAASGGGNSYFIGSPEDAPAVFGAEFEDIAALVAQNVSVEIRPTEDVKVLGILNEYPQTQVAGGVQLALGDAYGDEIRRVVFQMHIPSVAALGVAQVAEIVLRYVGVGEGVAAHEVTIPVTVNMVSSDEAAAAPTNQEVIEEVVILKSANVQREARKRANEGNFDVAKKLLRDAADELRSLAPDSKRAAELSSEAETLEGHHDHMDEESWDQMSMKAMHYDEFRKRQSRRRPDSD